MSGTEGSARAGGRQWCEGSGRPVTGKTYKRIGNTPIVDKGKCGACGKLLIPTLENRARNHKPLRNDAGQASTTETGEGERSCQG